MDSIEEDDKPAQTSNEVIEEQNESDQEIQVEGDDLEDESENLKLDVS